MNVNAKSNPGTWRLPVQWLDSPAVGVLVLRRRSLRRASRLAGRGSFAANPGATLILPPSARALRRGRPLGGLRAFTLLELMMVLAIIGFISALTLPHVAGFGQANSMSTATRQLLDDVALARQRAMVNRSTVYMVFLPPMFWTNQSYASPPRNPPGMYQVPSGMQVSNLITHQYSAYALISFGMVGDQPGMHHARYLTDWRFLPNGVFIAPFEFNLRNAGTNIFTTNTLSGVTIKSAILPWSATPALPFPSIYPPYTVLSLPAIAFSPQGSLTTPFINQYIALARGSIFYPTDPNGLPLPMPPNVNESPPGNDANNPNLIQIDWMTARATLVQNQLQ